MKKEIVLFHLSKLVYLLSDEMNEVEINHFGNKERLQVIAFKDESASILNGLQVGAFLSCDNVLYIVVRGADVGIGKRLFHSIKAETKYIPKTSENLNEIKTTFQDWFYSSMLAPTGIVPFYQYQSLVKFFDEITDKHRLSEIVVGGVSLGGCLAQKLYLEREEIRYCITFSAISPWWTFSKGTKKQLREENFLNDSDRIINYYSNHDIFRLYPLFSRNIGKQCHVSLKPYVSKSNIFASILERICWGHIPNYYGFTRRRDISTEADNYPITKAIRFLNKKIEKNMMFNLLIFLALILHNLILFLFFYHYGYDFLPLNFLPLEFLTYFSIPTKGYFFFLMSLELFVLLPSILSRTRWKFILLPFNLLAFVMFWIFPILLVNSILTNDISDG